MHYTSDLYLLLHFCWCFCMLKWKFINSNNMLRRYLSITQRDGSEKHLKAIRFTFFKKWMFFVLQFSLFLCEFFFKPAKLLIEIKIYLNHSCFLLPLCSFYILTLDGRKKIFPCNLRRFCWCDTLHLLFSF